MGKNRYHVDQQAFKKAIGFGVAGNFAGHLEQAGEAGDFVGVVAEAGAPKGVFPFYVPGLTQEGGQPHPLSVFPVSSSETLLSRAHSSWGGGGGFQVEPEIGLWCELVYGSGRAVTAIKPLAFGAFNDCSHRRAGASKISEKKNWGPASKGFAIEQMIAIDRFEAGGVMDHYRLASFLKRGDALMAYGEDSSVAGYGYMYGQLLDWLIDKLNHQQDAGPLENLAAHLKTANDPAHALIAIGATRYTDFGETNRLRPGEVSYVVAYDSRVHDIEAVKQALVADEPLDTEGGVSVLRQEVMS